jgi:hypothetical protein
MVVCKLRKSICEKDLKECGNLENCHNHDNIQIESETKEDNRRLMEVLKKIILLEMKINNIEQQVKCTWDRLNVHNIK